MPQHFLVFKLLNLAYSEILRSLLIKAIDDPEQDIDELIISILDRLFDYKEPK